MSHWNDVKGHDLTIEQIKRAHQRGRLSHAYLFVGPSGVGKRLIAQKLAQALFCESEDSETLEACGTCPNCKRFQAGTHPDYYEIGCPEGKKSIPIELFVGSDDHRGREGLCYELSLKPMASDRKIALIDDCHLMQSEAANSLLKTLEEPPPNSLIILITDREEAILPTIRSRCQLLRFQSLSVEDMVSLILSLGYVSERSEAEALAGLSEGSLENARELSQGRLKELTGIIGQSFGQDRINPLKTIPTILDWIEDAGESSEQRKAAFWLLKVLAENLRTRLRDQSGNASMVDNFQVRLSRVREAEQQLHEMMPIPLWVEGLVHDLSQISRLTLR